MGIQMVVLALVLMLQLDMQELVVAVVPLQLLQRGMEQRPKLKREVEREQQQVLEQEQELEQAQEQEQLPVVSTLAVQRDYWVEIETVFPMVV